VLDRLKGLQLVFAQVAAPHCPAVRRSLHGNAADPDHNGKDMQSAGENDVIHDRSGGGVMRRALDNADVLGSERKVRGRKGRWHQSSTVCASSHF
jgi:hypothetical protein